jgi:predicted ester cyclase
VDTTQNKAVVEEFDQLGNGIGNVDRLDVLCTQDLVNHALALGRPVGLAGTREFLRNARRDLNPPRWVESYVLAENDLVVQFGTRAHHWDGGTFRGFDTPPGPFTRDSAFAYRLRNGQICERWAIRDDLAMILQLGGRPAR